MTSVLLFIRSRQRRENYLSEKFNEFRTGYWAKPQRRKAGKALDQVFTSCRPSGN